MPGVIALLAFLLKDVSLFVSHVKNHTFPQPLSAEQEAEFIRRMENGDGEARNLLIEHNLRLVAHVAKKFTTRQEDADDFISIGTIGLIKAVESYHSGKGTKLATYAARCIENEILMHLRSVKRHRKDAYLSDPIGTDKDGNELTIADLLGSDPDAVVDHVDLTWEKQKMFELMPTLPEREREVLCKRYGLPYGEERTQREIAQELGISRSYVSRIEHRALTKLHERMRGSKTRIE
ncbi:RNA polymerase sporulation sigma factor SigK [Alicyclobacillus tolerans]|uniref:RNA polymerase sigma factor n=2 Tax=Alicyclobacillus tolerans TaxID=90970 RepID=A0A1M6JZZ3_9BACL|nr:MULTISPECIES: RNA polymerase sporulation sigma factor SigK [Alicyclobacillus]MDP9727347.1 RNA polymerase sporulation-specific sigma factor [Alicyclobacillus tengchongensis]QRF23089.1 RNA polymerase sporulation sigma factor SigK [Alicyclobacillus sp. TC]SHJ52271.1 RNA polymerase, sigma 27/28 subunit, RpsK/SigK [Alicyclobacillus montanus]